MLQTPLFSTVCKIIAQNILCTNVKIFHAHNVRAGTGTLPRQTPAGKYENKQTFHGRLENAKLVFTFRVDEVKCFWLLLGTSKTRNLRSLGKPLKQKHPPAGIRYDRGIIITPATIVMVGLFYIPTGFRVSTMPCRHRCC